MTNFDTTVAIAAAMNGTWTAKRKLYDSHDDNDDAHRILAPNGAGFYVSFNNYRYKDRIIVSGVWPERQRGSEVCPRNLPGQPTAPSITINKNKTPEQIAKDIERRILPEYLPLYEQCYAYGQELNRDEDKELTIKQEIADYFGERLSDDNKRPGNMLHLYKPFQQSSISVRNVGVQSNGNIRMELSGVPYETAMEIFRLLKNRGAK